jgi:hypothetical protein
MVSEEPRAAKLAVVVLVEGAADRREGDRVDRGRLDGDLGQARSTTST